MDEYKAELARYGCESLLDEELVKLAGTVSDDTQATLLESQLARSLMKPAAEQAAACNKYLNLYAKVTEQAVHPLLWKAAQVHVKGST